MEGKSCRTYPFPYIKSINAAFTLHRSINRPICRSFYRSIDRSIKRSINMSRDSRLKPGELILMSINISINRSISRSILMYCCNPFTNRALYQYPRFTEKVAWNGNAVFLKGRKG